MNKDTPTWETRLMDEFCVMFSRAEREHGESGDEWVEKLENFIRSTVIPAELEAYRASLLEKLPRERETARLSFKQAEVIGFNEALRQVKKIIGSNS